MTFQGNNNKWVKQDNTKPTKRATSCTSLSLCSLLMLLSPSVPGLLSHLREASAVLPSPLPALSPHTYWVERPQPFPWEPQSTRAGQAEADGLVARYQRDVMSGILSEAVFTKDRHGRPYHRVDLGEIMTLHLSCASGSSVEIYTFVWLCLILQKF